MSEKHTPGPWRVRHRHYDAGPNEDEIGGLGWELEGPPEPMRGHFALAADAHLVAAAPDLLEANRLLLNVVDRLLAEVDVDSQSFESEIWHAQNKARAAIRRAEGGGEK